MSCLQIPNGGASVNLRHLSGNFFKSNNTHSLSISNLSVKSHYTGISTAASGTPTAVLSSSSSLVNGEDYDKFDEWIRNSVTEIVRNVKQAPLLVQIYADEGVMKTETAVEAEDWPELIQSKTTSPDGIILVEELGENVVNEFEDGTKAFGVLIQGKFKGRDRCKSACYLLKTSSVNGGIGGAFCTHFCLMKVRSFSKTASSQFNDCWLLQ